MYLVPKDISYVIHELIMHTGISYFFKTILEPRWTYGLQL